MLNRQELQGRKMASNSIAQRRMAACGTERDGSAGKWMPMAAAALLALGCATARAQQLIAPTATVAGLSQSFIAAQFGQWALAYPAATNPLLDATGANSAAGNQGSYFFLGGSFSQDPVVRNVKVRPDQTLVINLTSVLDWMGPGVDTEALIREEAANVLGINPVLSLSVDGASALMPNGFTSLEQFRQSSPLFPLTFIDGNVFGWPASVVPAIVDGYIVALQGLSLGQHQLHVTTLTRGMGPFDGYSFTQDVTYNITSVPEPGTWATMGLGLLAIGAGAAFRRRGVKQG